MPVSERKKKCRKLELVWNWLGASSMGPNPPALCVMKPSSTSDMISRNGAEKLCRKRIDSTPRHTTNMFSSQKPRKHVHSTHGIAAVAGHSTFTIAQIDCPPIHDWMPNHPHATNARNIAGTFAPLTPNDARTNTGKGIPYFVPACAFRIIGIRTMRLPSRTVAIACFQFIPPAMRLDANMYVVTSIDIENHNAMKLYVPHVRCSGVVGARSAL